MTIDITPESVERLALDHLAEKENFSALTAYVLRALSAALTASQAETAADYEAAAKTYCNTSIDWTSRTWLAIRALTPDASKAALDRMIAEAEGRGMRKALDAASDYTQRVYGDDWKFLSNPIDRERILAAIPKGTSHE